MIMTKLLTLVIILMISMNVNCNEIVYKVIWEDNYGITMFN